ncbi:hypothetical protein H4R18_005588 [Coemansia javaensis]|uniref:Tetratricopeptide repeat protein n=1 Tax=Coemansia javaensis TaxID=2761396 RepID=A0A9W8LFC3_9FUNG|nr:hypothetical protein H4R18_005588 [Coemansia javaensis]
MTDLCVPTAHDANLVSILLGGAGDGAEYVRDQISGTYAEYDPGEHVGESSGGDSEIGAEALQALREREARAVRAAEAGDVARAVDELTQIIADEPRYASAYNNRAQALRLQGAAADAVVADLDRAIALGAGRTLALAFTQKGVMLRERGDQDGAFYCFSQGAKLGCEVAKAAAARENPYAKMCGSVVAQAMRQLRTPAP